MTYDNKTILISGASSGIGAALASELAKRGATVYAIDKTRPDKAIDSVDYLLADLTDIDQTRSALSSIKNTIDVLINNAGIMRRGTILDATEEDFDLLIQNNLKSSWLLLKLVEPLLSEAATVVQISSGHALKPEADPGLYTLTKMATAALAEILALTRPNLHVKTVYPGPVLTPLLLSSRSLNDQERIKKIATKPTDFAKNVADFIQSDGNTLQFDNDSWSYKIY